MMTSVNHLLAWLLTGQWAVPLIITLFVGATTGIVVWNWQHYQSGTLAALRSRLRALRPVIEADSTDGAHAAFKRGYEEIDIAMREPNGNPGLVHAWTEYSQTIVGQDSEVLLATTRPYDYFLHLGDDTRVLAWWANISVAAGLTFTFLGIIAALTATTDNMTVAGNNTAGMTTALVTLLTITSAKFWTSVMGVLCSIVLRVYDRLWHSKSQKGLAQIADAIERGTLFYPPQQIAADQLFELKEQSTALREFSTQLAVGISDALAERMQPVVAGLSGIQASIDDFRSGVGREVGTAIGEGAGAQIAALGETLHMMSEKLAGVNERVDASGQAASEQIAAAAREFSTASDAMTRAFGGLNDRISEVGARLTSQMEDAAGKGASLVAEERERYQVLADGNRDTMRAMGEAMQRESAEALTAMRGQLSELGESLTRGVSEAADRNADLLAKAAQALEEASARAATGMSAAIDEAMGKASAESERAMTAAFAQFGDRFAEASQGLVSTLTTTAGRMEALAGSIERSTGAANDHATKLSDAGREAQAVGTMLGRAAADVQGAANPLNQASEAIRQSVGQSQKLLADATAHQDRHTAAIERVSESFEATSDAAERAWDGYRERFDGVDKALAEALDRIKGASADHAGALNEQVDRIDRALAKAVDKLQQTLDPLADLAQSLEDMRARAPAE